MTWAWSVKIKFMSRRTARGQSLIEVLIALAIFAVLAAAMVSLTLCSLISASRGGEYQLARSLAAESLAATRGVRDRAWNEFTYATSTATSTTGQWQLVGEGSSDVVGAFSRTMS